MSDAHSSPRLLVSTRKGLFTLGRHQGEWKVIHRAFVGDNVSLTHVDAATGTRYAALDHGHFGAKLHRSEDGVAWTEVKAPIYPPKPESTDDSANGGAPVPWDLKRIWSFASGADGELWCGTIPGGLFRSRDRGDSWELCESLWMHPSRKRWMGGGADHPGIHSVLVDPRDPRRVLVGVSCGGVWETLDDGASWTVRADGMRADFMPPEKAHDPEIQDPHLVVACPTAFDRLWTQHHCGIWQSRDGARSWQEVESAGPSTFGFAVAVHPHDPDTAWFVPAVSDQHRIPVDGKLVVTRTRDGGASFDVLTKGLPAEDAYDLVYRHALDVDARGEMLAFGSTTGALFVSEDGGDSWRCPTAHLPPIYALQFDSAGA